MDILTKQIKELVDQLYRAIPLGGTLNNLSIYYLKYDWKENAEQIIFWKTLITENKEQLFREISSHSRYAELLKNTETEMYDGLTSSINTKYNNMRANQEHEKHGLCKKEYLIKKLNLSTEQLKILKELREESFNFSYYL